jgi:glycine/D-amino acid oxidase-like deaminating enzyme
VRLCEQSPVTRLTAGRIETAQGRVQTGHAVLATNAYSHQLHRPLLRRYLPLYDYIIVSEPLRPEQLAQLGWRNRQAVIDGRTFFNYYRLTDDHRILWGGSEAAYYRGNEVSEQRDQSGDHFARLIRGFREHFPYLDTLNFPYAWGGPICSTTRLTPFFGQTLGGWLSYGLGYTGLGIASTHLAGKILAHLALGQPSPLLELAMVRRPPLPFPPEPLRHLAVQTVSRALRRVDAGRPPSLLLRTLDRLGIGFSS